MNTLINQQMTLLLERNEAIQHFQQPLLAGESIGYKHGFADILAQGALGCINPDICLGGGLLEMHEIAAIAE